MHKQQVSDYEQMVWNQRSFQKTAFFRAMGAIRIEASTLIQNGFLLTHGDRGWLAVAPVFHNGDVYRRAADDQQNIYGALSVLRRFGLAGYLLTEQQVIERALAKSDFKCIKRRSDQKLFQVAMLDDWPALPQQPYSCALFVEGDILHSINPERPTSRNKPKDQFDVVADVSDGVLTAALRARIGHASPPLPLSSERTVTPPQSTSPLREGGSYSIIATIHERNPIARQRCIQHYGLACNICAFSFVAEFGEAARHYIHVHHIEPVSTRTGNYEVDPIKDLRPVCPNCHAVIHLRQPPYSIAEIQKMRKIK